MSSREPARFQIRARECRDSRLTGKAPVQGEGGLLKPFLSPGDQSNQANSNKTRPRTSMRLLKIKTNMEFEPRQ